MSCLHAQAFCLCACSMGLPCLQDCSSKQADGTAPEHCSFGCQTMARGSTWTNLHGMLCLCHVHRFCCRAFVLCTSCEPCHVSVNCILPGQMAGLGGGLTRGCPRHSLVYQLVWEVAPPVFALLLSWLGWCLPLPAHVAEWTGQAHAIV